MIGRGAALGVFAYLLLLGTNLVGDGTLEWAFPSDACARVEVHENGVVRYPDCPTKGRAGWIQYAVNFPVSLAHDTWPADWLRPQEFRIPPRAAESREWSVASWLAVGCLGYSALGAAIVALALLAESACPWCRASRGLASSRFRRWSAITVVLGALGAMTVGLGSAHGPSEAVGAGPDLQPMTSGPGFHFFGYYDKFQVDVTGRYALGMRADSDARPVHVGDSIEIGVIDLLDGMSWTTVGTSSAWNWQQGCMLQWLPGTEHNVVWNDRGGDADAPRFVTRIHDMSSGRRRELPHPIYTIAPDGNTALSLDFERLFRSRAGYGYPEVGRAHKGAFARAVDDGIYVVDMRSGVRQRVVELATIVALGRDADADLTAEHYFDVLSINPAGTRFSFYERWTDGVMRTRAFTVDIDGGDIFLLSRDLDDLSHVAWLDDDRLVIYSRESGGYGLFEDRRGRVATLLGTSRDGHQSFLPGGEWMLSDTYADAMRQQHLFLYHVPTRTTFSLAHLLVPPAYEGSVRCDLHPRLSRDGRRVFIDSAHAGGRQMYMLDIGPLLDAM